LQSAGLFYYAIPANIPTNNLLKNFYTAFAAIILFLLKPLSVPKKNKMITVLILTLLSSRSSFLQAQLLKVSEFMPAINMH
jgi:hypothetical protein